MHDYSFDYLRLFHGVGTRKMGLRSSVPVPGVQTALNSSWTYILVLSLPVSTSYAALRFHINDDHIPGFWSTVFPLFFIDSIPAFINMSTVFPLFYSTGNATNISVSIVSQTENIFQLSRAQHTSLERSRTGHASNPKMLKHLVGIGSPSKPKRARSETGHLHLNPYGLLFTPD